MGNKSIDYTLKTYGSSWNPVYKHDSVSKSLIDILRELNNFLEDFFARHGHSEEDSILGMVAAVAALERCVATFYTIFLLMGRGYFIEALVLNRHIIEQCAWALTVQKLKTVREIEKVEPSKCIKKLNFHSAAGKVYGFFSDYVHLSAKKRGEYIRVHNNLPKIIQRSTLHSLRLVPLCILTLDIYISTYEKLCLEHHTKTQSWKRNKKGKVWKLDSGRPLLKFFKKHRKNLSEKALFHN